MYPDHLQHFLELVRDMVDEPQDLVINLDKLEGNGQVLRIYALARDVGRLIGVGGRNARALRVVLAAVCSARGGGSYMLEIEQR